MSGLVWLALMIGAMMVLGVLLALTWTLRSAPSFDGEEPREPALEEAQPSEGGSDPVPS